MTAVTRSAEPEQRLTEALRARATGAGRVDIMGRPVSRGGPPDDRAIRLALLVALGIGVLVGVLLAVISLASPGALPPVG
jgi:hypothetical protein